MTELVKLRTVIIKIRILKRNNIEKALLLQNIQINVV